MARGGERLCSLAGNQMEFLQQFADLRALDPAQQQLWIGVEP